MGGTLSLRERDSLHPFIPDLRAIGIMVGSLWHNVGPSTH